MLCCPSECGWQGSSLSQHYRFSPPCKPLDDEGLRDSKKRRRDPSVAAQLFANRIAASIGKVFLQAHVDCYMTMPSLDICQSLLILCAEMCVDFIEQELGQLGCPPGSDVVYQSARQAFSRLPNAGTLVSNRRAHYMRAVPRHLSVGGDKKGAAFFDAHTVVTIMLQECKAVRKLAIESSDLWKAGSLFKTRPAVQTDLVHGTRFLDWHAVCGKASPDEANDLRILLHGWTDEFTPIDGLSQKARAHKYGAFLIALVNLPLRIRHYADHVLMLALYNSRRVRAYATLPAHSDPPPSLIPP
jgi:hypothetical protein